MGLRKWWASCSTTQRDTKTALSHRNAFEFQVVCWLFLSRTDLKPFIFFLHFFLFSQRQQEAPALTRWMACLRGKWRIIFRNLKSARARTRSFTRQMKTIRYKPCPPAASKQPDAPRNFGPSGTLLALHPALQSVRSLCRTSASCTNILDRKWGSCWPSGRRKSWERHRRLM